MASSSDYDSNALNAKTSDDLAAKKKNTINKKKFLMKLFTPGRAIVLAFLAIILLGSVILVLPISLKSGIHLNYLDALFTSISSVCITGLATVDIYDTFNLFGDIVILLLVQIGGIGVTSIGVGLLAISGRKIGIRGRTLFKEEYNQSTNSGAVSLLFSVLKMTFVIEFIGFLSMFATLKAFYSDLYNVFECAFHALFHTIMSFNNAGMDLSPFHSSLAPYKDDIFVNIITCALIVAGGLGFYVIRDIMKQKSLKKLSLHSKIVIYMTAALLVIGFLVVYFIDFPKMTVLEAIFTSINYRTAGFYTIPHTELSTAGLLIGCVLMYIGGSPGSTGGGIKTTTAFVLGRNLMAFGSNKDINAFNRRITKYATQKAMTINYISLCLIGIVVVLIVFFENILNAEANISLMAIIFEAVSAYTTTGCSMNTTTELCIVSRIIIMFTMFIGRIGLLTISTVWVSKPEGSYQYPEEEVMIG